ASPTPSASPLVREQLQQKREPGGPASPQPAASPTPSASPLVREQFQQKREPGGLASPQPAASPTTSPTGTKQPAPATTPTPTPSPTLLPGAIQSDPGAPRTQTAPAGGAAVQASPGGPGAPAGGSIGTPLGKPTVNQPLPPVPPPAQALAPIAPGATAPGPRRMEDFRGARQESDQGGRKVFTEPGRVIVVDPSGQSFIRHNEEDRFRYGARDIRTEQVGNDTRTIVIRPDGSQIITVVGRDGQLMRRIRRDREGREIIIIDNTYRDPLAVGGFYVELPPPVIGIPYNRYIVESDEASPDVIYETMEAPPVQRIERRYSLDEIRYSPSVRALMPSIDLNTINFETGSWEIPPDQAAKLQAIADGLNRAIARNPREVFLIEGHTDAVGNDVDNLSLSDRRAQSAAELLTQQFQVPAENLTSQGYGSQYLKEQTSGPSRINRRVTIRRITPLLNGGTASLPPPPPGIAPPR
ncbi:OmpA family protein, partial [Bradyrhizobium sp.]|uniref:OmpA family protein n=1 Tax=Bradyrhizobium sp. TaxID=376 RepID=UPI0025C10853